MTPEEQRKLNEIIKNSCVFTRKAQIPGKTINYWDSCDYAKLVELGDKINTGTKAVSDKQLGQDAVFYIVKAWLKRNS